MRIECLRVWDIPYPGVDVKRTRSKQFQLVRIDGKLAFGKSDIAPEYVAHESEILGRLDGVEGVPSLVFRTPRSIYMTFIDGELLQAVIGELTSRECVRVGYLMIRRMVSIHRKGIVHSDIRPWNFMYDRDRHLYLIDFEYAYDTKKTYTGRAALLLSRHHGRYLKLPLDDWRDTFICLAGLWKMSRHRIIQNLSVFMHLLAFILRVYRAFGKRVGLIRPVSLAIE